MADIKFEIMEKYGVISQSAKGWAKELNLVKWNDRDGKFDIREWSPDHEKIGKGITLTKDEIKELKKILDNLDLE